MTKKLSVEQCPDPTLHGNPFRYCPYCEWKEADPEPTANPMDSSKEFEEEAERILGTAILKNDKNYTNELVAAHHKATQERVRDELRSFNAFILHRLSTTAEIRAELNKRIDELEGKNNELN